MKAIVCELCESTSFTKQGDMYVCNSCGAQVSVEDAKKMMKEVDAPAAEEKASSDFEKYVMLARRADESSNHADAAKYYSLAQTENPNDWESVFFGAYHTAMQTNIAGIASAATLVANATKPAVELLKAHTPESVQPVDAMKMMMACINISNALSTAAVNHYNGIDVNIRSRFENECYQRVRAARMIPLSAAVHLEAAFGDNGSFHTTIGSGYKHAISICDTTKVPADLNEELIHVAKYDREFAAPRLQKRLGEIEKTIAHRSKKTKNNGCFGFLFFVVAICLLVVGPMIDIDPPVSLPICAVLAVLGILCFIPVKKGAKQLAEDAKRLGELMTEKTRIKNALGE